MVKSGYKQTEIGALPEEWEVKSFSQVGDYYKGKGISMKDTKTSGFPCIMYGDIYVKFDTHFSHCDYYIDQLTAQQSVKANPEDLFFTASGETAEDIGRCVSYQGTEPIYIGGDIIVIHPYSTYNSLFLSYVQNSVDLKRQKASFAQGHSVVHISSESIKKCKFACPLLPEQKAIATALSDIDSLIYSLEKLIAKKKAIKQGAMQELLTGKRRLPGFAGEWKEESFFEVYDFAKEGGTPSTSNEQFYRDGSIPFAKIDDLYEKYVVSCGTFITQLGLEHSSSWLIPSNSLLLSNGATIGLVSINSIPLATKQGIIGIVPKKEYDIEFLYYVFSSNMFYEKLKSITTHGTMDFVYIKDLNQIVVEIPFDILEQKAIASILSDMDSEIEQLEKNLSKYKKIKSGMMSELLTGRIRLV